MKNYSFKTIRRRLNLYDLEHPPNQGVNWTVKSSQVKSKPLIKSGNMGYKDKTSSWHLIGFPDDIISNSIGSTA